MTATTENLVRETLGGIYAADYRGWDDGLNNPEEFVRWAKSRARAALAALDAEDTAPPEAGDIVAFEWKGPHDIYPGMGTSDYEVFIWGTYDAMSFTDADREYPRRGYWDGPIVLMRRAEVEERLKEAKS